MYVLSIQTIQAGDKWQEQYDLGVRYLQEGKYDDAVLAFTAAIEIDPKRAPAFVGRGDALVGSAKAMAGDITDPAQLPDDAKEAYEKAISDYREAIGLDASNAACYRSAAEAYRALGQTDEAIAILTEGYEATGDESLQTLLQEIQGAAEPAPEPEAEQQPPEPAPEPGADGHTIYPEFLNNGGWDQVALPGDNVGYSAGDITGGNAEIYSCLADFDGDGADELFLQADLVEYEGMRGHPIYTAYLDQENGNAVLRQSAFYNGGGIGGDRLTMMYDTETQKNVLVLDSEFRDGMWCGINLRRVYDDAMQNSAYDIKYEQYKSSLDYDSEIARVKGETSVYTEEDGTLMAYTVNGQYVTQDEYNAMMNRFTGDTVPALEMQQVTAAQPVA